MNANSRSLRLRSSRDREVHKNNIIITMGSLLDEIGLDLIFDASPVVTATGSSADDASSASAASRDHSVLLSGMPRDRTISTSAGEWGDRASAASGPCSNDNPSWDEGTLPCPNTAVFEGVFEGAAEQPIVVSNEFNAENVEATEEANGYTDSGDIVDAATTSSPSKKLSTPSPSRSPSSSPIEQPLTAAPNVDTVTSSPSKNPSISPVKPPEELHESLWNQDSVGGSHMSASPSESPPISPSHQPSKNIGSPPNTPSELIADNAGNEETADSVNSDNGITFVTSAGGDTGYPSFYSCSAASEEDLAQGNSSGNDRKNEELLLRFDYEMYTPTRIGDDITPVLIAFERQLANGVAVSLGLTDCATAPDIGKGGVGAVEFARGGQRLLSEGSARTLQAERYEAEDQTNQLLGMSINPLDELDTELSQCTSSENLGVRSICSPIIGSMTFWATTTQQRHLRHLANTADWNEQEIFLRNTVALYFEQNGDAYLNDVLLHIAYIGQRNLTVNGTEVSETPRTIAASKKGDVNPVLEFVSMAVAGLFIVLVGLGVVSVYRRRLRQRSEAEPPGIDLDVETGAFPCLPPSFERMSNLTNNEETQEDENIPSNSLIDLQNERELAQPSSLAAMGDASALTHQLSYAPPHPTSAGEESVHSNVTENHSGDQLLDSVAPTIQEASREKSGGEASEESSAFDTLDKDNHEPLVPPMSLLEDIPGDVHDILGAFKDRIPTESDEDEDEPQQSRPVV